MKKVYAQEQYESLSYEIYKELAYEICAPIGDSEITVQLRFELYQSKLIYLYNINEQCFKSINSSNSSNKGKEFDYTIEDLINIKNAIEITQELLRQTIRESINLSIKSAEIKGLYASRFQNHLSES